MTLRSSIHHRSKADIVGFARLILEIANANASVALEHAHKVYEQTRDPKLKAALEDSLASYNMVVKVYLREALNAMDKGDYNVVKHRAHAAGIQAESCEKKFRNMIDTPLRDSNRYVRNLCAIAVSIVNKLLQANKPTST